jgi:glycosyltransferase involved in cell wall biosynthesis
VIIPVYNGSNYLKEAIDSAVAQTYMNTEILVIDDGSNDGGKTEQIAKAYGTKIRYFYKENGGVASALNLGIREMTGEYFSWLSHDDVYYPNKIDVQMAYLKELKDKEVVLYSDYDVIDGSSKTLYEVHVPHYEPEQFLHELVQHSFLHGCTTLVPKTCFETVGAFNERLPTTQDYELWVRMAKRYPFVHLPKRLIQARHHSEQGCLRVRHLEEIDQFYVWSVAELQAELVPMLYGIPISEFYFRVAEGYRKRNLRQAYQAAVDKALRHSKQEGIGSHARVLLLTRGKKVVVRKCIAKILINLRGIVSSASRKMLLRPLKRLQLKPSTEKKFRKIYDNNLFGGTMSKSGPGSDLTQTAVIRKEIPKLLKELNIRVLMDAPCGDFFWMKETALGVEKYIGIDIVENIIRKNRLWYGESQREFLCRDIIHDMLPRADIILCRDCFVHQRFEQARAVIMNFKRSGAIYLLTTTFTERKQNVDLEGEDIWRPLNLELSPFNFPNPLRIIKENCTEANSGYQDKSLGLWRLQDISD